MDLGAPRPPSDLPDDLKLDFDAEARRLRAALGLDGSRPLTREFHDMDKIWTDKRTGGSIWVGNEVAAKGPLHEFERRDIAAVVNCTDDMVRRGGKRTNRPCFFYRGRRSSPPA